MRESPEIKHVLVTGATGFVGREVVRGLLSRGMTPVCLVRSPDKLPAQHPDVNPERWITVVGSVGDHSALRQAAGLSQAAIHLVGIILGRRMKGQTFERVHVRGTQNVVDAVEQAGIKRFIHMSALGARPDAPSEYHRSKWASEECVTGSGLDRTIFRPSLIHGPHGEFMLLIKRIMCGLTPPVIPYFGDGLAKVQPVSVKDVAFCVVESIRRADTIGESFPLGGPRAYTWIELYNACRAVIPGSRRWKPFVSLPPTGAKLAAALAAPPMALAELIFPSLGMLRFDAGQVDMALADSICDHTPVEEAFGIRMRSFEDELAMYADQIP